VRHGRDRLDRLRARRLKRRGGKPHYAEKARAFPGAASDRAPADPVIVRFLFKMLGDTAGDPGAPRLESPALAEL